MAKTIAVIFCGCVFAYAICLISDMDTQALQFLIASTIIGILTVIAEFVENRQEERHDGDHS